MADSVNQPKGRRLTNQVRGNNPQQQQARQGRAFAPPMNPQGSQPEQQERRTVIDINPVEEYESLLEVLGNHYDRFPTMFAFCSEYLSLPGLLLNPDYLDVAVDALRNDSMLYTEAESWLYLIHTLELFHFGLQTDSIMNRFLEAIARTRQGIKNDLLDRRARDTSNNGMISINEPEDRSNIAEFLNNNRPLLGVFIFSFVMMLFEDRGV